MCVRDSIIVEGFIIIDPDTYTDVWNDRSLKKLTTAYIKRAVSYTHLRAHETVLDLVCRLLLEKKNNETKNNHY